jgi:hypothetical protein
MNASTLCDIDDKVDIGVIVVVRPSWNFDISVSHSDVLGIDTQILWRSHDGKFDSSLGAECLVGPFSNGSDLLNSSNTVVGNQDLERQATSLRAY